MSTSTKASTKVPEFVYANNGARYHPCLYCCRAFAHKRYLSLHMKACVRTHLNEDNHKPSVSVFPSSSIKQERHILSYNDREICLSDEITIEKMSKQKESDDTGSEDFDENEEEDLEPTPKKLKLDSENSEDENANMPGDEDDNQPGNSSKDNRKFSMENACKLCDEIFTSLDELIMHAKIEHNQRSKDNKKRYSPEDIEYFLKVFTKLNKSHCPICRKAILNTLNWRGHLYTHCTVRKFVCKICGKWFTRGDHCKQHEQRHKHGSAEVVDEEEGE